MMGSSTSCHAFGLVRSSRQTAVVTSGYTLPLRSRSTRDSDQLSSMVQRTTTVVNPRITRQSPTSSSPCGCESPRSRTLAWVAKSAVPDPGTRPAQRRTSRRSLSREGTGHAPLSLHRRRPLEPRRVSNCVLFSRAAIADGDGMPPRTQRAPAGDARSLSTDKDQTPSRPKLEDVQTAADSGDEFIDISVKSVTVGVQSAATSSAPGRQVTASCGYLCDTDTAMTPLEVEPRTL